ncbi:hypothetical protein BDZ91DRAFT_744848 [Kalaharituber pfeilii]|nr:hypothetical protein BDZ91DRAFT_744848 [Kalaharituber pfeilii]
MGVKVDKRWEGLIHLPVSILLLIFATSLTGLCAWQIAAARAYYERQHSRYGNYDYGKEDNYYNSIYMYDDDVVLVLPEILVSFAPITIIHAIIDIALYLTSKLQPVYVISMSSVMLTIWLGLTITAGIFFAFIHVALCFILLILYIVSVILSSRTRKRMMKQKKVAPMQITCNCCIRCKNCGEKMSVSTFTTSPDGGTEGKEAQLL